MSTRTTKPRPPHPIVGASALFPGSSDATGFWRDILAGTSADPKVLRLLPPFTLSPEHVDLLRAALADIGA